MFGQIITRGYGRNSMIISRGYAGGTIPSLPVLFGRTMFEVDGHREFLEHNRETQFVG